MSKNTHPYASAIAAIDAAMATIETNLARTLAVDPLVDQAADIAAVGSGERLEASLERLDRRWSGIYSGDGGFMYAMPNDVGGDGKSLTPAESILLAWLRGVAAIGMDEVEAAGVPLISVMLPHDLMEMVEGLKRRRLLKTVGSPIIGIVDVTAAELSLAQRAPQ
jgi:hypothetical protein